MTKSKVPMITDLSEENRRLALKQTERLLYMLSQCECYVRDYASGTQNVANSLWQKTEISRAVTRHAATER